MKNSCFSNFVIAHHDNAYSDTKNINIFSNNNFIFYAFPLSFFCREPFEVEKKCLKKGVFLKTLFFYFEGFPILYILFLACIASYFFGMFLFIEWTRQEVEIFSCYSSARYCTDFPQISHPTITFLLFLKLHWDN